MESDILKITEINCNDILPNRFQPRIIYNESDLLELSDSIKKYGLIQPIVVRRIGKKYEIIIGERRYKASILAGLDKISAIVKDVNDNDYLELSLVENVQRKNLSPIEEALSYQKITKNLKNEIKELSQKIGKSEELIENKIKLLNLSDNVQEALINNEISERHARSLLKLTSKLSQSNLLERIINERLTVKRTDEEIEKIKKSQINTSNEKNKEEEKMNNDPNFMFNSNNQPKTFNIFETSNSDDLSKTQEANNIFSTEPAAPTFINNNAPIFTQVSDNNNYNIPEEDKKQEPMFVLFDDESNNSPNLVENTNKPSIEEENKSNNIFSIQDSVDGNNTSNVTINANNPEKSPIIISDYEKQYDPIMPQNEITNKPKVDMRTIINMIRNCQKEIENFGYTVELDEYDLADSYQVTFKVEKK